MEMSDDSHGKVNIRSSSSRPREKPRQRPRDAKDADYCLENEELDNLSDDQTKGLKVMSHQKDGACRKGNTVLLTTARQKRRKAYEKDKDFKVRSYIRKQCEQRNATVNEQPEPQLCKEHGDTLAKHKGACTESNGLINDTAEKMVDPDDETESMNVRSQEKDEAYVNEIKGGWTCVENIPFSTFTRVSEIDLYEKMAQKCEEWNKLCQQTFTEMIRCCICGVCELGSVRKSTFEYIVAHPELMVGGDVPSRAHNPGLPGKYVTTTDGVTEMWKVCKDCKKDPQEGFDFCVDFGLQSGEYLEWIMASDIEERQALQCVDVGYQISKARPTDTGYTGQAHGFAMFMAPIIRAVGSVYQKTDDSEPIQSCDTLLYTPWMKNRLKKSSQKLLIYNLSTNRIYHNLRCMAEIPDFNGNSFLSHDIVQEILELARNKDPLITRVDNQHAEAALEDSEALVGEGQKDKNEEGVTQTDMCRTKDKDPVEDLEEEAVDNTADDAPRQNMIVLPVDPPYKSVLTNDTLLSVGHVYPREGTSKEIFLSRPQGESSLEIDGQVVTLESTLFPYLFPEGKGCYTPAEGSRKTSLSDFQNYMKRRMSTLFSPFTMIQEYILMMYQIVRVMLCTTSGQKHTLKSAYDKRLKKYPRESEHDRIKNLVTYVMPKSVPYSPSWWRHKLNDLIAITRDMGLPHYFLTLTVDNTSELRWDEYNSMESILGQMNRKYRKKGKKHLNLGIANAQAEAAALFHTRVSNFMDMFILEGHKTLGEITHHVVRYEMQGRQALHAHILLWSNPEDVKKRPCKLGYPYDIYNGPTMYDEHRKEYLYKCPNYHSRNVVSYHPELMLAWNAHMCLKRVTHADFSYYLLKYTLKSEPTGQLSLNKEVESQMNMTNLDAGVVKVVNAMTQSQPVSEVEAALQMMRVPIVYMHIKYDNNVVDKSPVQFLMSTPPDLRKATVGMARGTITSHMDYYENRPDDTLINRMSYMKYHRNCYFPGKLLTSDRKQSKYVGTDMKGRHVYYRDHRKIVRIANYWPSNDPENFFYTVILSKVAFRLEGSLRNNDSETYYEHCQLAGLVEPLDRVKQGHCSKLEAVLQEYYTDHFTKKYCIESTIDEILEYYDTRKHKTEVTAKVNASLVDQFNSKHLVIEGLPELNSDQAKVFSKLARENFVGLHVIKGPAGTGKSVLIRHIVRHCTNVLHRHVLVTATSGTAASRLPGGKTLHSALSMGQGNKTSILSTVFRPGTSQYAECKKSSVLIIDEAFMLSADFLLTAISKYASTDDISYVEDIFSLKGVILVGDDNQLPPVCQHKPKDHSKGQGGLKPPCMRCLTKNCILFKHAMQYELTVPERQKGDPEFRAFIQSLHQQIPTQDEIQRVLGEHVLLPSSDKNSPNYKRECEDLWLEFLSQENAVSLHAHRETTAMFNNMWLDRYLGQEKKVKISPMTNYDDIYAIDPVAAKEMHSWYYDKKFHELAVIAVGCPVVSLTNKHYKGTYLTNGSIGVVQAIYYDSKFTTAQNDEPVVKRIDVLMDGCETAVPVYRTTNTTVHNGHTCKRKNFPLLLGKSMTIHKCQGSSMAGPVLLDFRDLFEVGMGYVLLTRKTSRDQLALTCCPTPEQLQVLSTYSPPSGCELRNEAKKEPKTKGNKHSHVHSQAQKLLAIDRSANTFMDKPHTRVETGQQWLNPIPTTVTSIINANDWISNFANPVYESTRDFLQHIPTASMKKLVDRKQALEMNTMEWLYNEEIDFYAKYIKWRLEKNSSWCHILETESYLLIFRNNDPLEHILSAWKNIDSSAKFICAFTAHDSHYSLLILGNFSSDSGSPYAFYLDSLPASMASVEHRVSPSILGQFIDACPWRTSPLDAPVQIECLSVPQQKLSDGNCGPYVLLFFQRFLHMLSKLDSPPSQEILREEILSWRTLHHSPAPYSEYAVALRHNYAKLLDQCALLQGSEY
ncbi:ATP-dependent DNA helicase pif1 [Picochlorum sp. SENEW3]|nr:ATP-dependent DNA helicase pif1 [Picochlorum sp. SENEW3]WPT14767.1 ATP-dependent DNA helicase pif1 [Picochlorum sp. SENEW3]